MIVTLIKSVATIHYNLEELTGDVRHVQADILCIKEDIHYIKGNVTLLKENQQTMLLIQQEQQKILERLSFRSITQEADIAELRRMK
jgi:hypothetical protein